MVTKSKFVPAATAADRIAAKAVASKAAVKTAKHTGFKAKPTPSAKAAAEAVKPVEDVKAESAYEACMRKIAEARDDFLASQGVPSKTRVVVATISHLLSLSVTLYWGIEATTALMTAAFMLTSSAFITWVLGFMGLVLAVWSALAAGRAIGSFVLGFDYGKATDTGRDLRIAAAKKLSLVKGWFTKRDEPVAA